jgi:transposase-like protein
MNIISVFEEFPTQDSCVDHLELIRWPSGPQCSYCNSHSVTSVPEAKRHHCNNCNTSFSVTVGTIFHHTHLPLQKWFLGISLILNAKKGISARQLARDLDVNRNTGWRMAMQIRKAMSQKLDRDLLTGIVEADECYVSGKPRKGDGNDHPRGRGTTKTPVVGMVERGDHVKANVVPKANLTSKKLSSLVRRNVDTSNTMLITDEFKGYIGIKKFMSHETVDHQAWYVDGFRHTNNIESFWALLKRGIVGQFHKVSLRHLPKYVDEFTYRFNDHNSEDMFHKTVSLGLGVST